MELVKVEGVSETWERRKVHVTADREEKEEEEEEEEGEGQEEEKDDTSFFYENHHFLTTCMSRIYKRWSIFIDKAWSIFISFPLNSRSDAVFQDMLHTI